MSGLACIFGRHNWYADRLRPDNYAKATRWRCRDCGKIRP